MITGLKVTVPGKRVLELIQARGSYHHAQAAKYLKQKNNLNDLESETIGKMSNDPRASFQASADKHTADARELAFIAEYLDTSETYLLDRNDLNKLGIVASAY